MGETGIEMTAEDRRGAPPIRARIKDRIVLLDEWTRNGVPKDRINQFPRSLVQARVWSDRKYKIYPIPSPNDFLRNDKRWGELVQEIDRQLAVLCERYRAPTSSGRGRHSPRPQKTQAPHVAELKRLASEWSSERSARLEAEGRANAWLNRGRRLLDELDEKDETIANLLRQLADRQGLRTVT